MAMSCDDDDPRPSPRLDGGCRRWRPEAASFRGDTPSSDITGLAHFRRAIIDCDERCWSEIIAIYDAEVRTWCRRAGSKSGHELDEAVCLTWEKFWHCFGPEKLGRANSIAQVMQYLQMCAHSVALDALRARTAQALQELDDTELSDGS